MGKYFSQSHYYAGDKNILPQMVMQLRDESVADERMEQAKQASSV